MECVIHVALSPVVKGENFGPRRRRKVPRYLANPSQRMHSHHSHSGQFCSHADPKSTLRNVIQEASKLGFTHFGLSEHVPRETMDQLYPEEIEKGLDPQKLQDIFVGYLKEARELQGEHLEENGIKILVGAETENVRTKEEDVEGKRSNSLGYLIGILEGLREQNTSSDEISSDPEEKREISEPLPEEVGKGVVDYLVGSVHHVHGIPIDFDKSMLEEAVSTFGTADVGSPSGKESRRVVYHNMVSAYLDAQYEVLQRLRPEVIGHLDLPFLFDPSSTWTSSHLEDSTRSSTTLRGGKDEVLETSTTNSGTEAEELSWSKLKRNVKFACSYGALFEINGAAFRKGWETAYPSTSPLKVSLSSQGPSRNQISGFSNFLSSIHTIFLSAFSHHS